MSLLVKKWFRVNIPYRCCENTGDETPPPHAGLEWGQTPVFKTSSYIMLVLQIHNTTVTMKSRSQSFVGDQIATFIIALK